MIIRKECQNVNRRPVITDLLFLLTYKYWFLWNQQVIFTELPVSSPPDEELVAFSVLQVISAPS